MDRFPILKGERTIRFGCGAVFGFVAVLIYVLKETMAVSLQGSHLLIALVGAVVAGLLSVWLGDSFWMRIATWFRRW
jgi:FtsH-binding integral membrane protein